MTSKWRNFFIVFASRGYVSISWAFLFSLRRRWRSSTRPSRSVAAIHRPFGATQHCELTRRWRVNTVQFISITGRALWVVPCLASNCLLTERSVPGDWQPLDAGWATVTYDLLRWSWEMGVISGVWRLGSRLVGHMPSGVWIMVMIQWNQSPFDLWQMNYTASTFRVLVDGWHRASVEHGSWVIAWVCLNHVELHPALHVCRLSCSLSVPARLSELCLIADLPSRQSVRPSFSASGRKISSCIIALHWFRAISFDVIHGVPIKHHPLEVII